MRQLLLGWLVIWITHANTATAADAPTLPEAWFAAIAKVDTWSADCLQTRAFVTLSQPLQSTGRVWVARSSRFRWELGQPAQTIAIRQPDWLWLIYPRLNRAEKYPLQGSNAGPWNDMLALLDAGFPRDRADFEARLRPLSVIAAPNQVQIRLEPKSQSARRMIQEIQVDVRTSDYMVVATEMRFSDGSRLRNDFTNIVINATMPANCFEPDLGPNTTIVEPLKKK